MILECKSSKFHPAECRRRKTFYSHGGVLCRNLHEAGNCKVAEVALAVNLNGNAYTEANGITYQADHQVPFYDLDSTRSTRRSRECIGVIQEERQLYCNYIEAISSKAGGNRCLEYYVPVGRDGSYELIIKMGEFMHDKKGERTFSVHVNNKPVLSELDLLTITDKNTPIDLSIPFFVVGNKKALWMRGYPLIQLERPAFRLGFCFGTCHSKDPGWTVSAFSVVRFQKSHKNTSEYTVLV